MNFLSYYIILTLSYFLGKLLEINFIYNHNNSIRLRNIRNW